MIIIIRSIRTPSSTTDDEQKLIYKRILRGGEIPATGLQKFSVNNRGRHMVRLFYANKNIGNSCNLKRKKKKIRNKKSKYRSFDVICS
jgi:hypothetical protein